jgi:4-hydroxymandelate oxidase
VTVRLPRLADYEARAREVMPAALFAELFGTAENSVGISEQNNLAGYRSVKLRPRVLIDVRNRRLGTTVMGRPIGLPVMLAPVGKQRWAHPAGEPATARAAARAGTVMVASTASNASLEDIAAAAGAAWFQLYYLPDRDATLKLVRRAEAAGYCALVVTVDIVAGPVEHRVPDTIVWNAKAVEAPAVHGNFAAGELPSPAKAAWHESGVTWADLEWLRTQTRLPMILKGIQCATDARRCVEIGAAGLMVSNHGGRTVEDAVATVEQLAEVSAEVGGELELYLDGGIRKGVDVLKALALGARAVLIGRPILWGLAAAGEEGVHDLLELLRVEFDTAMAYCGVVDATAVPRDLVKVPADW